LKRKDDGVHTEGGIQSYKGGEDSSVERRKKHSAKFFLEAEKKRG